MKQFYAVSQSCEFVKKASSNCTQHRDTQMRWIRDGKADRKGKKRDVSMKWERESEIEHQTSTTNHKNKYA